MLVSLSAGILKSTVTCVSSEYVFFKHNENHIGSFWYEFHKTWVCTEFSLPWQCISYYCDVYNCIFFCNSASSFNKENLQNPLELKNLICAIAWLSVPLLSNAKYSILSLTGFKFAWLIEIQHLSMNLVKLILLEKFPIRIIDSCTLSFDHMKIKFSFFRKI